MLRYKAAESVLAISLLKPRSAGERFVSDFLSLSSFLVLRTWVSRAAPVRSKCALVTERTETVSMQTAHSPDSTR